MISRRAGVGSAASPVNATPMIDVMMCLIVFFLLVGSLAAARLADIDLPFAASPAERAGAGDPVVISVLATGAGTAPAYFIDGLETASLRDLEAALRGKLVATPGAPVELRADRSAPFGVLRPVLVSVRASGAGVVRLVAQPAGGGS